MRHTGPLVIGEPRGGRPASEETAFAGEVDRHLGALYRFALFWHEDRAQAEELVVRTVSETYRRWRDFPSELDARLRFFSSLRANLRPEEERAVSRPGDPSRARGALGEGDPEVPRPLPSVGREEAARTLRSLAPRYRELLTLRLAGGLSPEEIAHLTGDPAEELRAELIRAREALEDLIAAEIASQGPAAPEREAEV